eukprot:2357705-Rhodomonas_salina.1
MAATEGQVLRPFETQYWTAWFWYQSWRHVPGTTFYVCTGTLLPPHFVSFYALPTRYLVLTLAMLLPGGCYSPTVSCAMVLGHMFRRSSTDILYGATRGPCQAGDRGEGGGGGREGEPERRGRGRERRERGRRAMERAARG